MSEENTTAETEGTEEAKAPAGPAKLIRGRMPLPLVWHIRFVESATTVATNDDGEEIESHASDSAVAKKFFTTAGKIMDIRTNRNFKYLHEGTKFSQADIDAAKEQLKKNIAEGKMRGTDEPSHDYSEDDAAPMFELLDTMVADESTIEADRAAYNEANPRKKKETPASAEEKVEETAEDTVEEVEDELEDELEEELDEELEDLVG